jgi:hypothetical protein
MSKNPLFDDIEGVRLFYNATLDTFREDGILGKEDINAMFHACHYLMQHNTSLLDLLQKDADIIKGLMKDLDVRIWNQFNGEYDD